MSSYVHVRAWTEGSPLLHPSPMHTPQQILLLGLQSNLRGALSCHPLCSHLFPPRTLVCFPCRRTLPCCPLYLAPYATTTPSPPVHPISFYQTTSSPDLMKLYYVLSSFLSPFNAVSSFIFNNRASGPQFHYGHSPLGQTP